MSSRDRLCHFDNLRTFLVFLVVLVHAGVVYEASGLLGPYWLVDDPATSDLPGLVNLMLDIFVMPTFFFISGYLAQVALARNGSRRFVVSKLRRLMLPWAAAVLTLIPAFNAIYLYSRGLPQQGWANYFHFSNSTISMSWLWFLPVLFLFDLLYVLLHKLDLPTHRLSLGWAVAGVFALNLASSLALSRLGWIGWTKTPLLDFQNERLLPYFLVFLLGSLCSSKGLLLTSHRNMRRFIAVNATVWIPAFVYMVVLVNYFLRPGQPIISAVADNLLLWTTLHLSMLGLLYCTVMTFTYYARCQGRLAATLSRLSYGVYIVHMAVMGPIAVALLHTDLPALLKYPILTASTYVASNLVVLAYKKTLARVALGSRARTGLDGACEACAGSASEATPRL